MAIQKAESRNPWVWVPSLYFTEAIPYVMVMSVSVMMYKNLNVSNADIAFFTSLLYFPWFLKFLWGPFIDMFKTKRFWTITMQLIVAIALFGIAISLTTSSYWSLTLIVFALMAFASATHDIAADGLYLLSLKEEQQSAFVGVRSTFYRIATIVGSGLLVVIAGQLAPSIGFKGAWSIVFVIAGVIFVLLFLYHKFILPYPLQDKGTLKEKMSGSQIWFLFGGFILFAAIFYVAFLILSSILSLFGIIAPWKTIAATILLVIVAVALFRTYVATFVEKFEKSENKNAMLLPLIEFLRAFVIFMQKKDIWNILGFLLFFRFAEAQLVKLVQPFLLDPIEKGGLGLTTSEVGIVYGTVGIIALTVGGLIGGYVISKKGLKWWLWPMVLIMHTPDLAFVYLSQYQPANFVLINLAVAFEQFGYGFGFTAYMMYMIMISQGEHKTAHFAICTGIMALGMMLPGMYSGALQEQIGYSNFFLWVIISTIPGFIVAALVKIEPEFGKKKAV
ncbi:MAG: MFS transporter [Stygiobacter sp. RIFOXYC12_FULL_38_8]|nr:MAG: MFS transporter [Stygiobacter sp. GWC2_38_9]OGV06577.1 MAG: MFS transporter [Stygiobacter sp. RIFOXYB2_FULL_37_11]OGV13161.1 MAG: MFS transporter [Stygiobacter sp. RIFOXYC2_FULL_38_25]OGV17011.1 MAG: MFS transporter [Stygiobacter sp. RIFOXYA2_FULL_38_8]OGV29156.1 MAG: MFS transporter [Stygiobacter sp. RIFOXYC12_FULL_38_8]OGV83207.1 MAG: MFS transporter [Stygiobacter sp. GWF2_38_21]RJQ58672.1 MAG: MFS transporter [Stygiobacter sp.]